MTIQYAATFIQRHLMEDGVSCSREDAFRIFRGVYRIGDDNFSAFEEDGRLVICKNGFPIHKLNVFGYDFVRSGE